MLSKDETIAVNLTYLLPAFLESAGSSWIPVHRAVHGLFLSSSSPPPLTHREPCTASAPVSIVTHSPKQAHHNQVNGIRGGGWWLRSEVGAGAVEGMPKMRTILKREQTLREINSKKKKKNEQRERQYYGLLVANGVLCLSPSLPDVGCRAGASGEHGIWLK